MLRKLDETKGGKTLYLNVLTNQTGTLSKHNIPSSARRVLRESPVKDKRHFSNNRKRTNGRTIQSIQGTSIFRPKLKIRLKNNKPIEEYVQESGKVIRHETNPKPEKGTIKYYLYR